ncbi:MAG TPA: RagB/SusD family nutrient uptake outer membrane protein [Puia sp.]|nr:RagB/SusD family nutrient uptake outer membrane protein [Puia sp.]
MKKLIIYSLLLIVLANSGCQKKILDKVDFAGVPVATTWGNVATAQIYLDNLYQYCMPVYYSNTSISTVPTNWHNISDECNGGSNIGVLQGNLTQESENDYFPTANSSWQWIRKINILLTDIDKYGLTPDVTAPIKAQAYFLRAWVYFQLLKAYGGVPYVTKVYDYVTDSLNVPRNSTTECVDSMIADLNHCSVLPAHWSGTDVGRITSGAALAFKGRILLYYASPQFNPTNDQTRWQLALQANKAAYDSLTAQGYALATKYSRVFLDAGSTASSEAVIFREYNGSSTISQNANNWDNTVRPYSQAYSGGGKNYNPTWNLVQAYPMADGYAPGDPNSKYTYDSIRFWHNRDPRFYATIVYNGAVYGLGNTAGRIQYTYVGTGEDLSSPTTTGFYCRKNVDTSLATAATQYGKTWWVEMRFAEVMLNYAECANATGDQATAYSMLTQIRKRAGISANSDNLYGLTAGMSQADMETAILNERRIEFAFEDKRYDDLRRTRTFDQLNTTYRMGFFIVPRAPYYSSTKAGKPQADPNNIERYLVGNSGLKVRDTINVEGPAYQVFFRDSLAPISGEKPINFQTTYYAYGIPSTNISKQPALQQTLGWTFMGVAGTFDPTK